MAPVVGSGVWPAWMASVSRCVDLVFMAAEASTTAVAVYPSCVRLVCFIALVATASVAHADAASDEARRILAPSCPDCHARSSPKSVAKALAVFDFDDAAFFQHMTPLGALR